MCPITRFACALLLPIAIQAAGSNGYVRYDLVADTPGVAALTDPNLISPWGVSVSATSPFWVSNRGSGTSTLYNGSGTIIGWCNHSGCDEWGESNGYRTSF